MDRVKNYSGTISEDTATKAVKQYYGATSNTTAKKGKTELLIRYRNSLLNAGQSQGMTVSFCG